jgi:PadR family transcriptional regulator PadR
LSSVYKRGAVPTARSAMPKPKADRNELLQGTLDLLVLKTVARGPEHGWGIAQRIRQISGEIFQVNQGSLYPALHRLEERGWVASEWGVSDANRQAKFYRLTRAGERQLARETENWAELASGMARILEAK